MPARRRFLPRSTTLIFGVSVLFVCLATDSRGNEEGMDFERHVRPLFAKYCFPCHDDSDPNGNIDLMSPRSNESIDAAFDLWRSAVRVINEKKMPPEKELAPTDEERSIISQWFQSRFVDNVVARPGPYRPRRLSAREYRHTLRSLLGFDLQANVAMAEETITESSLVMKLLPTDPIGPSGYRNDTFSNPLTPVAWESYSQLADSAIEELFSTKQKRNLESLAGFIPAEGFSNENAERLIRELRPRALRRTNSDELPDAFVSRLKMAADPVAAAKFEMKTLLMSPGFLYRGLMMITQPGKRQPVDSFELAERLSYFLWADMPDRELLEVASRGPWTDRNVLHEQTERMLDSPKAFNLAEDWAVQWLLLDDISTVSTNVPLVRTLKSQPIDFINYLIQDDRPLLELLESDVDFINIHTAGFYDQDRKQLARYSKPKGIENEIVPNQRIRLEATQGRGGILTMPGILVMNRGPIIRGTWILERILGEFLPEPPANVGQVQPNKKGENLTFRQRFELHRAQPTCALCHDKIDPLGFALEAYDEKGAYLLASNYQSQQLKKTKVSKSDSTPTDALSIDTSGRLPTGERFDNLDDLKKILTTSQREAVIRNIVTQMLSYAICRKSEFYDQPTINDITRKMLQTNGTFRQLIHEIVSSLPFQEIELSGETP